MSLHLSAPVHVFAPQLVNVSPPQLLLLLPELLCLLSLGWKQTSQLENIHNSCLSVYLSHRLYICSSLRVKLKKTSQQKTLTCCLSSSSLRLLSSSCASRIRLTLSKDCHQQIFKVLRKEIAANVFFCFWFSNPLLTRSSRSFSLAAESARPEKREKLRTRLFKKRTITPTLKLCWASERQ